MQKLKKAELSGDDVAGSNDDECSVVAGETRDDDVSDEVITEEEEKQEENPTFIPKVGLFYQHDQRSDNNL